MKRYMDFFKNGTIDTKAHLAYLKKVVEAFKHNFIPEEGAENGGRNYIPNFRRLNSADFEEVSQAYTALLSEIERQINEDAYDGDLLTQTRKTLVNKMSGWLNKLDSAIRERVKNDFMREKNLIEEGDELDIFEFVGSNSDCQWKRQVRVYDNQFSKGSLNEMKPMGKDEPLFPDGSPRKEDVIQDTSGSCYMLSGLRMLAENMPEYIKSRMIDNGDNTVTVYFQELGPVTVDKSYPKNLDKSAAPWVRILEKAYVAAHLKNTRRDMSVVPEDEFQMKNLLWGQEGSFLFDFMPIQKGLNTDNISVEPNRNEARRRLKEIILASKDKHPTIIAATDKHAVSVEGIVERDGKVYLNIYDQYKKSSSMVNIDTFLNDSAKYKTLTLVLNEGNPPHEYMYFDGESMVNNYSNDEKPVEEEGFVADFSRKFRNAIRYNMRFDAPLTKDDQKKLESYLKESPAIQNLLKREFTKLEPSTTKGDVERMQENGSPYLAEMLKKITAAAVEELKTKNDSPIYARLKDNLSQPEKLRAVFGEYLSRRADALKPSQKSEAEMTKLGEKLEKVYAKQEKERISKAGSNSPEFEAMTNALRDLNAVMKNPNMDKSVIRFFQCRAYAKCNFYQKNRNPYSPSGKRRKNAAIEAMKTIEEMNPTVRSDIYSKTGKEMLVEMACICANKEMEPEMRQYKTANNSIQNMGRLGDEIKKYMDNPILQKLGESFKYQGSDINSMVEKLCQKESQETLMDFMSRKLPQAAREWHKGDLTDEHMERALDVKLDGKPEAENIFHM